MHPQLISWLIVLAALAVNVPAADAPQPALIPAPQKVELRGDGFQLTRATRIYTDDSARDVAEYLAGKLRPATAFPLRVEPVKSADLPDGILLTTQGANTNLGPEGYGLSVSAKSVVLRAPTAAGLFYGAQTLLQLLPTEVFSTNRVRNVKWKLPGVHIEDQPRFAWRGMMLMSVGD